MWGLTHLINLLHSFHLLHVTATHYANGKLKKCNGQELVQSEYWCREIKGKIFDFHKFITKESQQTT